MENTIRTCLDIDAPTLSPPQSIPPKIYPHAPPKPVGVNFKSLPIYQKVNLYQVKTGVDLGKGTGARILWSEFALVIQLPLHHGRKILLGPP